MAKAAPKKSPFSAPKRDTSNTKQAKASSGNKSSKPMKQCKCGGHG